MSESDPKDAPPRTILGIAPPPLRERTMQGVAPPSPGAKLPRHQTLLGVAVDPNRVPPPNAPSPPLDQPAKPALELVISSSTSLPAGVAVGEPVAPAEAPLGTAAPRDDIMSLAPAGLPRRGRVGRVAIVVVLGGLAVAGYVARRRVADLAERYVLTAPPASATAVPAASTPGTASASPSSAPGASSSAQADLDAGRPPGGGGGHHSRGPHVPRGRSH